VQDVEAFVFAHEISLVQLASQNKNGPHEEGPFSAVM
jgi:hypothetical protein